MTVNQGGGIFKGRIAHGLLVGSLFGTIFGVTFPGCIYLSQSFKFIAPIYLDENVAALVRVTSKKTTKGNTIVFCSTTCYKETEEFKTLMAHLKDKQMNDKNNNGVGDNDVINLLDKFKEEKKQQILIDGEAAVMFLGIKEKE